MDSRKRELVVYVEDDEIIRENFAEIFSEEGYAVKTIASYDEAARTLADLNPDLLILDIELGERATGGLDLCYAFRQHHPDKPVILLTSHEQAEFQELGWKLGADDFVPKSTNMALILVRIRALLSRYRLIKEHHASRELPTQDGLALDSSQFAAFWRGARLELSLTQFWILKEIYEKQGATVGHEALQQAANIVVESNTIVAHVRNIRAQFKRIDPDFSHIKTERGYGYRWV